MGIRMCIRSGAAVNLANVPDPTQTNATVMATTNILTSSLNPSSYGAAVTFTATISTNSPLGTATNATGTVSFYDGAVLLGTGTVASGVATLSTNLLSVGSHSISASYSGDTNYSGATSATLTQTVNAAQGTLPTTTILASSQNPSTNGNSVNFTATVSTNSPTGHGDECQWHGGFL